MKNQNNNGCGCHNHPAPAPSQPADINMSVCDRNANVLPMLQSYTTKVLKPNVSSCCRKNILTQQMMGCEGYKYVIKWDFDLNGQTITVPENCILEFEGGSLSNGMLIGNETQIIAEKTAIFTNITISGTWNVPDITSSWFGDALTVDNVLKQVFNLASDNVYNTLTVEKGDYYVTVDAEGTNAINLCSHLHLIIIGNIRTRGFNLRVGRTMNMSNKKDILITGDGSIWGDKLTHIYSDGQTHPDGYVNEDGIPGENPTDEGCHVLRIYKCEDITIDGLHIHEATGDGIDVLHDGIDHRHIVIRNFVIQDCRRQGITFGCISGIIENGVILNSRGTNPQSGIDIEITNNMDTHKADRIIIRNLKIENVVQGIKASTVLDDPAYIGNILIENVTVNKCQIGFGANKTVESMSIINSRFNMEYKNDHLDTYLYARVVTCRAKMMRVEGCNITYDYHDSDDGDPAKFPDDKIGRQLFDCSTADMTKDKIIFKDNVIRAKKHSFVYHKRNIFVSGNDIECYNLEVETPSRDSMTSYSNNNITIRNGKISLNNASFTNNTVYIYNYDDTIPVNLIGGSKVFENMFGIFLYGEGLNAPENIVYIDGGKDQSMLSSNLFVVRSNTSNLKSVLVVHNNYESPGSQLICNNNFNISPDVPKLIEGDSRISLFGTSLSNNILSGNYADESENIARKIIYHINLHLVTYHWLRKGVLFTGNTSLNIQAFSKNVEDVITILTTEYSTTYGIYAYLSDDINGTNAIMEHISRNCVVDLRDTFDPENEKTPWNELTPGKNVYIKGELADNGFIIARQTEVEGQTVIRAIDNFITQDLPNTDDGCIYICIGHAISNYDVHMCKEQYTYVYENGHIELFGNN